VHRLVDGEARHHHRELPVGPRGHEPQAGVRAGALLPGEAVERFVGVPRIRTVVGRARVRRADAPLARSLRNVAASRSRWSSWSAA
jgi:hypothetical protein